MLYAHYKAKEERGIAVYARGRKVGEVRGGVLEKTAKGKEHFLREPVALAISAEALEQAARAGAVYVRVRAPERRVLYMATLERIRMRGIKIDRGYGAQLALLLSEWEEWEESAPGLGMV